MALCENILPFSQLKVWIPGSKEVFKLECWAFSVSQFSKTLVTGIKIKKIRKYIRRSEKSKIYFKFEDWCEWREDTTKQEIDATFYRQPQRKCMLGQAITNAWGNIQPFAQKRNYDNINTAVESFLTVNLGNVLEYL